MLIERLGEDWPDMPQYWPLQQHDAVIVPRPEMNGSTLPVFGANGANVTLSFRFLCNTHPHAEVVLKDVLDSDVLVLNSGLWDISLPVGPPFHMHNFDSGVRLSLLRFVALHPFRTSLALRSLASPSSNSS